MSMRTSAIAHGARFWHGTDRPVGHGAWLRPDRGAYFSHADRVIEALLEQTRPNGSTGVLPRSASLLAVDSPTMRLDADCAFDAGAANLYEIEPIGMVYRNDHNWLRLLRSAGTWLRLADTEAADRGVRAYAHAYWSGAPSQEPRWEYRMAAAQVIATVRELGQSVTAGTDPADPDHAAPAMDMTC